MFAVFLENKKNTSSGTYLYDNYVVPPQFAFGLTTDFAGQLYGGTGLTSGSIPLNKPHILTAVHNTANSFLELTAFKSLPETLEAISWVHQQDLGEVVAPQLMTAFTAILVNL